MEEGHLYRWIGKGAFAKRNLKFEVIVRRARDTLADVSLQAPNASLSAVRVSRYLLGRRPFYPEVGTFQILLSHEWAPATTDEHSFAKTL